MYRSLSQSVPVRLWVRSARLGFSGLIELLLDFLVAVELGALGFPLVGPFAMLFTFLFAPALVLLVELIDLLYSDLT